MKTKHFWGYNNREEAEKYWGRLLKVVKPIENGVILVTANEEHKIKW